ncbi:MAG: hypothetical protein K8H86_04510, partial [Ignavibacteriaceae bacterium]|nr:hypothetical protein [Ignavibacteriaceae bacterium]
MKTKFITILLFFCFVAPLATTFVVLQIQKERVKKDVKWKMLTGINKEELVLLKFTEEEKQTWLNWKHSKEFEFKGEMYDVVKSEMRGDTTYYWCWYDHEETNLNKKLDDLILLALGSNPGIQGNQKTLSIFFRPLYFSEFIVTV